MAKILELFCEDSGHELVARSLIARLAAECCLDVVLHARSTRGGHGRAIREFELWQRALARGSDSGVPDLLVLIIDANCGDWQEVRSSLSAAIDQSVFPRAVVGCPEPHIERWCMADPVSFKQTIGVQPPVDPGKCERDLYKRLLRAALTDAGQPIVANAMEFAPELISAADLFRAAKTQRSLGAFVADLRTALVALGSASD